MAITIKDIARLTGTSPAAVSLVLNKKADKRVGAEKRKAILAVANEFGYRKNIAAQGLALRRTFKIAICVHSFFQYPVLGFFGQYETISLVARKLHKLGYGIDLLQIDKGSFSSDVSETLAQEKVDGILFVHWDIRPPKQVISSLKKKKIPVVALGSMLGEDDNWATIDREGGFYKATSYLLDSGATRIVLLDCKMGIYSEPKRAGYEKAMKEAGYRPYPVFSAGAPVHKSVGEAAERMLDAFPETEAVLISENFFAQTVMHILGDRQIRLIGFGDACFADICHPKLSYLSLPHERLVNFCVETLISQIESPDTQSPQHHLVECDLVIQET